MHIQIHKKEFLRILGRCQGVADKKSTMPVLANVLLVGKDGVLKCYATDLVVAVEGELAAKVTTPGTVAVAAKDLFDRVRMMPEGVVDLKVTDQSSVVISTEGSARRYTIFGVPGSEFPALPVAAAAEWATVKAAEMAELIRHTHFSISTDGTRLHLSSAMFERGDGLLRMVTTDGHRLSKFEIIEPDSDPGVPTRILIPLRAVGEIRKLCEEALEAGDANTELELFSTENHLFLKTTDYSFSVKLVDAVFPPYQQVIPSNMLHPFKVPRAALAAALRSVSLSSSERTGGVKATISAKTMRIEAESPERGEGFDEVAIDYEGPGIITGLNAKYVLDVLGALNDEEVTFSINEELAPAVIRREAPTPDGRDFLAVVMPMRI